MYNFFWYNNINIYSIYFSIFWGLILLLGYKKISCKIFFTIPFILSFYFFTQSRGFIIYILAIVLYIVIKMVNPKLKLKILLFTVIIFAALFFVKKNSSLGRANILNNCFKIIGNNFPYGVGSFKKTYNHFAINIYSKEAINANQMLADNIFFANNDYVQLIVEYGLLGLIIICLYFVVFFKFLKKNIGKKLIAINDYFVVLLLPFFIAGFISFPYHNYYSLYVFVLIATTTVVYNYIYNQNAKLAAFVIANLVLGTTIIICYNYNILNNQATRLKILNTAESMQANATAFECIKKAILIDGVTQNNMLKYAMYLAFYNNNDSAANFLNKYHNLGCSRHYHGLLANIYNSMGDILNMVLNLNNALYIAPHKLAPRMQFMQYYLQHKDTLQAIKWAKAIISVPIKIPTIQADNYKIIATAFLKNYYK